MPTCPECNRSFKSAHAVKVHVGKTHSKESKPAKRQQRPAATGPNLARISTPDIVAELSRRATSLDKVRDLIGE